VHDVLSLALADVDDPVIDQLALISVEPAPDAGRVLVTLAAPGDLDPDLALQRIRAIGPELREEVAAEIHRRRAPELVFRIALPVPV